METLWAEPGQEQTARAVTDALADHAYTTVATVLERLVNKGLVRRRMDGRTIRFTAIGSRGAHTAVLMHRALTVDADPETALVQFADTLTPSEAATLRQALDGRGRRR